MTEHYCNWLVYDNCVNRLDEPELCGKVAHFTHDANGNGRIRWLCAEHYDFVMKPACGCGGECPECGLDFSSELDGIQP